MSNYHIHTKLNLSPSTNCHCHDLFVVTKGASANFLLDFNEYSYLKPSYYEKWWKYIEQVTFVFKHPNKKLYKFNLFAVQDPDTEEWIPKTKSEQAEEYPFDPEVGPSLDPHFYYDAENENISLLVFADETAKWEVTEDGEFVRFEIAINADTFDPNDQRVIGQEKDAIIIEPQDSLVVVDSLYREVAYPED